MTYASLEEILEGEWNPTNCTEGIIDNQDSTDYHEIWYGIIYSTRLLGLGELGFSRKLANDFSGDQYFCFIVGQTRDEINDQLKELQRICIEWKGTTADIYRRLYIPEESLRNLQFKHEEYTRENEWVYVIVPLLASRVGESNIS